MSKKILSLALVLIMTLSLFTFPALAAGSELSIDKTEYSAGETITVTYKGVSKTSLISWIAVAPEGGAANEYLDWEYAYDDSGVLELVAPTENGTFEVRLYQGSRAEEANLVRGAKTTLNFSVSGGTDVPFVPPTTQPPTTQPSTIQPSTTQLPSTPVLSGLSATPTASTVLVNGKNVAFDAYNIGGNNYFKLRDIGAAFDFSMDWDGAQE